MAKRRFLEAVWKNLLMLNYEVDPSILYPYLPLGTEIDLWQGKALVSVVGFMFSDTKVLGVKWPFHINFEEVNLRFYVRRFDGKQWKRGAVFISEIVPKPIIAFIANNLYKEHYSYMPMRHSINVYTGTTAYQYEWKLNGKWNKVAATVNDTLNPIAAKSAEEFIFEHYWGYNKLNETATMEYQVEHVSWQTGEVKDFVFEANIDALYGKDFVPFLSGKPYSAYFANGSAVSVRMGEKIVVS